MVRAHQGGIRNHLNNLSYGWRNAGHTVHLFTPFGRSESFPNKQKLVTRTSLFLGKHKVFTFFLYIATKCILSFRLFWILLFHHYDIANARDVGAFNACFFICRLFKVPFVINLHGCLTSDLYSKGMIRNRGLIYNYFIKEERKSYKKARYLVTVGPQERNNVFKMFPKREEEIPIIYNLVNIKQFYPDFEYRKKTIKKLGLTESAYKILYVGRLSKRKGVEILIRAFGKFIHSNETCGNLIIVGEGPEFDNLKKIAKESGISELVVFAGLISHKDLNGYYNAADVVVIPSLSYRGYTEGTPSVALESIASGKPLITTPLGGLGDIVIDGKNGLIIEENSVDGLFHALRLLYRNPGLRQRLSNSAMEYVFRSRSIEKVAERWIDIFKKVINGETLNSSLGI